MNAMTPANPVNKVTHAVAWFEIPVCNLQASTKFYEAVLDVIMPDMEMGGEAIKIFPYDDSSMTHVSGSLHEVKDHPGNSPTVIHLSLLRDLPNALDRVLEAGGQVDSPIMPIPEGELACCRDIDGNRFSLFLAKA